MNHNQFIILQYKFVWKLKGLNHFVWKGQDDQTKPSYCTLSLNCCGMIFIMVSIVGEQYPETDKLVYLRDLTVLMSKYHLTLTPRPLALVPSGRFRFVLSVSVKLVFLARFKHQNRY